MTLKKHERWLLKEQVIHFHFTWTTEHQSTGNLIPPQSCLLPVGKYPDIQEYSREMAGCFIDAQTPLHISKLGYEALVCIVSIAF